MIRRPAAWVLALLLIPVLIIAGPAAPGAQAAGPRYGDPASYDVDWTRMPGPKGAGAINCNVSSQWAWDGFMQTVVTKGNCSIGWLSMGSWDNQDVWFSFTGTEPTTGADCNFRTDIADELNIGQNWSLTAVQGGNPTISPLWVPDPVVAACDVDRVCYNFVEDGWGDDKEHRDCRAVNIGYPEVTGSSPPQCEGGTVSKPVTGQPYMGSYPSRNAAGWFRDVTMSVTSTATTPQRWQAYVVVKAPANPGYYLWYETPTNGQPLVTPIGVNLATSREAPASIAPGVTQNFSVPAPVSWYGMPGFGPPYGPPPAPQVEFQVIGYGMFQVEGLSGGIGSPAWSETAIPGKLGVSDSSVCAYYWGQKITNRPADDYDEPLGPVDPPLDGGGPVVSEPGTDTPAADPVADEPESGGCNFSITDPSSWLEGGMCAAVGLLGAIVDMLGDVVRAVIGIPGAILGGLRGLFVPSGGFFSGQVDDVKDAWSDTPPVEVVSTFTGVGDAVGSTVSSGCGGPVLDVSMPTLGGGSSDLDLRPFSSCSDWSGTFARITRTVITLGTYLGALLLSIRILAASVGLQFSFGNGDD